MVNKLMCGVTPMQGVCHGMVFAGRGCKTRDVRWACVEAAIGPASSCSGVGNRMVRERLEMATGGKASSMPRYVPSMYTAERSMILG